MAVMAHGQCKLFYRLRYTAFIFLKMYVFGRNFKALYCEFMLYIYSFVH